MTNQDNLAEYADPEIYDLENNDFEPDGPFILALAQKLDGPVLEVGCGTGRLTIPLAQNGIDIVGVEVVPGMIERARQKLEGLPIEWVLADVRTFQLSRKFRLIFESGSVFHHMISRPDQEAYLSRVREHLEDNGQLVLNLFFPHPHRLTSTGRWTDASGQEKLRVAPLSLRYVFPQEMEALLHYNGFEIVEVYGDADCSPLTNESSAMIYVRKKKPVVE